MRLFSAFSILNCISTEIKFVDITSQKEFTTPDKLPEKDPEPKKEIDPFDILFSNTPQASVKSLRLYDKNLLDPKKVLRQ